MMKTFQEWVSKSDTIQRITQALNSNQTTNELPSLVNEAIQEAFKAGSDMMFEICATLQDNAEKNRAKDRYITNRIRSL